MLVVAYYERWSGRVAHRLTLNASISASPIIADKPSARDSKARPYLFKEFRRQPQRGWQPQGPPGQAVAAVPPSPTWRPVKQWARWKPQPQLGWTEGGDQVQTAAIIWKAIRQWKAAYGRQPQLGWAASRDVPVVPVAAPPLALHAYLFHGFRAQPALGWNAPSGVTPTPPSVARFTITRRRVYRKVQRER